MNKNILRQQLLGKIVSQDNDNKIIDNAACLIEKYNPRIVGIFLAQKEEIDLTSMMLKYHKIAFTLPKISAQKEEIFFTNYYLGAPLEPNEQYKNYLEPISNKIVVPDLVFVPGIAFDLKGHRLGRGKGHYDKYLIHHKIIKVGVSRGSNLLTRLPIESHDVKMDHIITENMILNLV